MEEAGIHRKVGEPNAHGEFSSAMVKCSVLEIFGHLHKLWWLMSLWNWEKRSNLYVYRLYKLCSKVPLQIIGQLQNIPCVSPWAGASTCAEFQNSVSAVFLKSQHRTSQAQSVPATEDRVFSFLTLSLVTLHVWRAGKKYLIAMWRCSFNILYQWCVGDCISSNVALKCH